MRELGNSPGNYLKITRSPKIYLRQDGLLKQLQKRLVEKAMGAELTAIWAKARIAV